MTMKRIDEQQRVVNSLIAPDIYPKCFKKKKNITNSIRQPAAMARQDSLFSILFMISAVSCVLAVSANSSHDLSTVQKPSLIIRQLGAFGMIRPQEVRRERVEAIDDKHHDKNSNTSVTRRNKSSKKSKDNKKSKVEEKNQSKKGSNRADSVRTRYEESQSKGDDSAGTVDTPVRMAQASPAMTPTMNTDNAIEEHTPGGSIRPLQVTTISSGANTKVYALSPIPVTGIYLRPEPPTLSAPSTPSTPSTPSAPSEPSALSAPSAPPVPSTLSALSAPYVLPAPAVPSIPAAPSPLVLAVPTAWAPGVPTAWAPGVPTVWAPGVPTVWAPGVPTVWAPGVPTVWAPGVPTVWAPGVPNAMTTSAPYIASEPAAQSEPVAPLTPSASATQDPAPPNVQVPATPVTSEPPAPTQAPIVASTPISPSPSTQPTTTLTLMPSGTLFATPSSMLVRNPTSVPVVPEPFDTVAVDASKDIEKLRQPTFSPITEGASSDNVEDSKIQKGNDFSQSIYTDPIHVEFKGTFDLANEEEDITIIIQTYLAEYLIDEIGSLLDDLHFMIVFSEREVQIQSSGKIGLDEKVAQASITVNLYLVGEENAITEFNSDVATTLLKNAFRGEQGAEFITNVLGRGIAISSIFLLDEKEPNSVIGEKNDEKKDEKGSGKTAMIATLVSGACVCVLLAVALARGKKSNGKRERKNKCSLLPSLQKGKTRPVLTTDAVSYTRKVAGSLESASNSDASSVVSSSSQSDYSFPDLTGSDCGTFPYGSEIAHKLGLVKSSSNKSDFARLVSQGSNMHEVDIPDILSPLDEDEYHANDSFSSHSSFANFGDFGNTEKSGKRTTMETRMEDGPDMIADIGDIDPRSTAMKSKTRKHRPLVSTRTAKEKDNRRSWHHNRLNTAKNLPKKEDNVYLIPDDVSDLLDDW